MGILNKVEQIVVKVEKTVIFFSTFFLLISLILQVFCRFVIKIAVPWTEEVSRMCFVIAIFYGASLAGYYNRHLGISKIVEKLPEHYYRITWFLKNIMIILLLIILLLVSFSTVMESLSRVYTMFRIPRFFVFIQIPIFAILTIFHIVMSFLRKDYVKTKSKI